MESSKGKVATILNVTNELFLLLVYFDEIGPPELGDIPIEIVYPLLCTLGWHIRIHVARIK